MRRIRFVGTKFYEKTISRLVLFEDVIIMYWFVFWLANGMDKFLTGNNLALFTWFGKDRTDQMQNYFGKINISEEWIEPTLHVIGFWEICIATVFLVAGVYLVWQGRGGDLWKIVHCGLGLATLTFMTFVVFDVVVGDRFEMLEHNVYIGMVIMSWFIINYRMDRINAQSGSHGKE